MNNPNPFVPQGSLAEQKNQKRARLKTAVFSILGINFLLVTGVLLIQGCGQKDGGKTSDNNTTGSGSGSALTDIPSSSTPSNSTVPPLPTNDLAGTYSASNTPPSTTYASNVPAVPATTTPATAVTTPASTTVPMTPVNPIVTTPTMPTTPAGPVTEYVVAKGDSLATIAKKVHVSWKSIAAANPGVDPKKMKVGLKLQIPAPAAAVASATPEAKDGATATDGQYVVKAHDNLWKIAKAHGVSIKALRAENHLKTDAIKAGEKLKIPAKGAPVSSASTEAAMPIPAAVLANSSVDANVSNSTTPVTH